MSQGPGAERRRSIRFPLALELTYAASHRRVLVETGKGRAVDLSSTGLKFISDRPLPPGEKLTVSIDWPVLLSGATQLQLFLRGEVVRTTGAAAALRIDRHEFKTRRRQRKAMPPRESKG